MSFDHTPPICKSCLLTQPKAARRRVSERRSVGMEGCPRGPGHEFASSAAEAARCALAQNKFWEFSEIVFNHTDALRSADLAGNAAKANVDMPLFSFSQCVDRGQHRPAVSAASQLAQKYGVRTTSTVFINGRMMAGAATLDFYRRIVSQELWFSRGKAVEAPR